MTLSYSELRASGKKPRVHGNGFLQLDLNDAGTKRLHIFSDDLPCQEVATPIHDHVFDMRSEVIYGTLIHEELATWDAAVGTHRIYRAQQEKGTQNTILVPDKGTVYLQVEQKLILGTGSIYTFRAWHLHQTEHKGFTATLMEKYNNPPKGYGRPRVLVPIGQKPDNDFHRDGFDEEFLWSFVETLCTLLHYGVKSR